MICTHLREISSPSVGHSPPFDPSVGSADDARELTQSRVHSCRADASGVRRRTPTPRCLQNARGGLTRGRRPRPRPIPPPATVSAAKRPAVPGQDQPQPTRRRMGPIPAVPEGPPGQRFCTWRGLKARLNLGRALSRWADHPDPPTRSASVEPTVGIVPPPVSPSPESSAWQPSFRHPSLGEPDLPHCPTPPDCSTAVRALTHESRGITSNSPPTASGCGMSQHEPSDA